MSRGLGKFQKKLLLYFQQEGPECNDILCIDTDEIMKEICGLPSGVKITNPRYRNHYFKVRKTIRRLDELGWVENSLTILNPMIQIRLRNNKTKKKFVPERYANICVKFQDGKILNRKTKETLDLRVQFD